ncbi:MAG: DUF423 domain-containing protein [Nevskia sp.]
MNARLCLSLAAAYGFLGVAFGAFGAHALRARLSPEWLAVYRTGVEYQLYHALALLAVGVLASLRPSPLLARAGLCFSIGILLFCGSLYGLALSANAAFGPVTPIGGLLLLAGWALLGVAALRGPA